MPVCQKTVFLGVSVSQCPSVPVFPCLSCPCPYSPSGVSAITGFTGFTGFTSLNTGTNPVKTGLTIDHTGFGQCQTPLTGYLLRVPSFTTLPRDS